jgi:hypothetical protein
MVAIEVAASCRPLGNQRQRDDDKRDQNRQGERNGVHANPLGARSLASLRRS